MTAAMLPLLAQAQQKPNALIQLLPLLLMVAVFYFLLIRPQQRRARSQRELVESIDIGDEVITIGGMFGTVRSVGDEEVTLEVTPGTEVRFLKRAIARKFVEEPVGEEEASEGS